MQLHLTSASYQISPLLLCPSLHLMLWGHLSLGLGGGQLVRWPKPRAFQLLNICQTNSDRALLLKLKPESQTSYFSLCWGILIQQGPEQIIITKLIYSSPNWVNITSFNFLCVLEFSYFFIDYCITSLTHET